MGGLNSFFHRFGTFFQEFRAFLGIRGLFGDSGPFGGFGAFLGIQGLFRDSGPFLRD